MTQRASSRLLSGEDVTEIVSRREESVLYASIAAQISLIPTVLMENQKAAWPPAASWPPTKVVGVCAQPEHRNR